MRIHNIARGPDVRSPRVIDLGVILSILVRNVMIRRSTPPLCCEFRLTKPRLLTRCVAIEIEKNRRGPVPAFVYVAIGRHILCDVVEKPSAEVACALEDLSELGRR